MTYIGILIGGVAGFLYWKFIGCSSGACPITSNKYISIAYGAIMGSLLLSSVAGSTTKQGFFSKLFGSDSSAVYQDISSQKFDELANDENTVIIDVRTRGEWDAGYIDGADLLIDYSSPDFEDQIMKLDPSKTYLVYCRSGNRSAKACKIMSAKGFDKLYNLSGGIARYAGSVKKD
ncbi:MAG: rhodanese-like domain-containing protein [Ignavibacteria bacterium]|nr:rhodanese-like domain-containing protein [Ignavibacteria bacterium]